MTETKKSVLHVRYTKNSTLMSQMEFDAYFNKKNNGGQMRNGGGNV